MLDRFKLGQSAYPSFTPSQTDRKTAGGFVPPVQDTLQSSTNTYTGLGYVPFTGTQSGLTQRVRPVSELQSPQGDELSQFKSTLAPRENLSPATVGRMALGGGQFSNTGANLLLYA